MPDLSYAAAQRLDAADQLAGVRAQFVISDPNLIYMDGNSLGRLPHHTAARVGAVVEREWGEALVRGWGNGWYEAPARVGAKLAELVGAAPGDVLACDSTSVNLFKLVLAALELRPGRTTIVSDTLNFPSDLYIIEGVIKLLGGRHQLRLVASSDDDLTVSNAALAAAIDDTTALVVLSHVAFKSGFLYDAAAVTALAQRAGALMLWDLSHSVGAVPIALHAWGADMAVGCSYKYLNGGPGAPAFLYLRGELHEQARSPIWGWFGQQAPFDFATSYQPAAGLARFLAGTPPILSLLAAEASIDLVRAVGLAAIRQKSLALSAYLLELFDALLAPRGFTLGSPRAPEQRGAHVSIRHPHGYQINRALIDALAVLPDFRAPDNIRLGLAPLYTSFSDVWQAVDRIRQAVDQRLYEHYSAEREAVT